MKGTQFASKARHHLLDHKRDCHTDKAYTFNIPQKQTTTKKEEAARPNFASETRQSPDETPNKPQQLQETAQASGVPLEQQVTKFDMGT